MIPVTTEIELADGTKFAGSIGLPDNQHMRMKVERALAQQYLLDFMNPEKMATVTYYYGVHWDIYRGFTRMLFMEPAQDGLVFVWFLAEGESSIERELTKVPDIYLPT